METLLIVGVILFVIAIVAYLLGARGVAGISADLGKWLIIIAVLFMVVVLIINSID